MKIAASNPNSYQAQPSSYEREIRSHLPSQSLGRSVSIQPPPAPSRPMHSRLGAACQRPQAHRRPTPMPQPFPAQELDMEDLPLCMANTIRENNIPNGHNAAVIAMIYLNRLYSKNKNLTNQHKKNFLVIGFVIAHKYIHDFYSHNTQWGNIFHTNPQDISRLEREMLKIMDYRTGYSPQEFMHAERAWVHQVQHLSALHS